MHISTISNSMISRSSNFHFQSVSCSLPQSLHAEDQLTYTALLFCHRSPGPAALKMMRWWHVLSSSSTEQRSFTDYTTCKTNCEWGKGLIRHRILSPIYRLCNRQNSSKWRGGQRRGHVPQSWKLQQQEEDRAALQRRFLQDSDVCTSSDIRHYRELM